MAERFARKTRGRPGRKGRCKFSDPHRSMEEGPMSARFQEGAVHMSSRTWVAVLILGAGALAARPSGLAVEAQPATAQDLTTTLDDQTELAVTVYNSEIALVRDVRSLQLARGTANLRFMDIAATVNPATVHF